MNVKVEEILNSKLGFEETFEILKFCSNYVTENDKEEKRKVIIRILENRKQLHPVAEDILPSLISLYGLQPYLSLEEASKDSLEALYHEIHRSDYLEGIYFHSEQLRVMSHLNAGENIVLSAPTSFGKSLLIEELIAQKKYKNIVVIQPTLALLDETRKKLSKYRDNYKLILSTKQHPSKELGNIFLFTGERVVEYKEFPRIDFFIIDEFYKLSLERDDERAYVLNQAFYKLSKLSTRFYLLGPQVDGISKLTTEKLNATWVRSKFATVAVDEVPLKFESRLAVDKELQLFKLLNSLDEPTLIYCSSPERATNLAKNFFYYLKSSNLEIKKSDQELVDLTEWINEQIHEDWILSNCLTSGVGIHHGSLPRHLGSTIVDLFNKRSIIFLFCTSTLIEGVNTSAKNIVLFDQKKGKNKIDSFDFQNIKGRSGRMNRYFTGKIFNFHSEPEQLQVEIDIPILSQDNAPEEILVHIEKSELLPSSIQRLKDKFASDINLENLVKINTGIPIDLQMKMIAELESDLTSYHSRLAWTGIPNFEKLRDVIRLIWKCLLTEKDNKASIRTPDQLAFITMGYLSSKSIKFLIQRDVEGDYWKTKLPDDTERINYVVNFVLSVYRQWFDFKLPKMLVITSNIQEYVFKKHNVSFGDYHYAAGLIENGFIHPNLLAVQEYDIPLSALRKLSSLLNTQLESDDLYLAIKAFTVEQLKNAKLLDYEINKILKG